MPLIAISKAAITPRTNYARRKLLGEISFGGKEFSVLTKARELSITHAVCGIHTLRGPMVLRWMKEHPKPEERREQILADITKLYGSAVYGVKFVDVYE